jgi:phosphatidylserine decarboxylase
MIRFHREGYNWLVGMALVVLLLALCISLGWVPAATGLFLMTVLVLLYGFVLQFFRNPLRKLPKQDDRLVYAPADGTVCAIEEVDEPEYFKGRRLLVSVFMSPLNVHVNRNPVGGQIAYVKYHPGRYLAAWEPKSSTENERTTVVYRNTQGEILIRQIAGALARRIRWYVQTGDSVRQGEEMGFIKFGSRVDLYLPLDAAVRVRLNDRVQGKIDVIAELPA